MRATTRDPISGNDVADWRDAPFVIEGTGGGALKIYFESERNKSEYMNITARQPNACSLALYKQIEDDEDILWD